MPHDQREGARVQACNFSRNLRDVVVSMAPDGGASIPQADSDLSTTIKVAGHIIEVRAIFGQNMTVKDGQKVNFFSYSVDMNLRSPAVERVTHVAEMARWLGLFVGGLAGYALYWFLFFFLAQQSGGLTIGRLFAILLTFGGAFAGWTVGQVIQGITESSAEKISKSVGGYDRAVSTFGKLIADVNKVLAETAKA